MEYFNFCLAQIDKLFNVLKGIQLPFGISLFDWQISVMIMSAVITFVVLFVGASVNSSNQSLRGISTSIKNERNKREAAKRLGEKMSRNLVDKGIGNSYHVFDKAHGTPGKIRIGGG